jgi:hypothetical protein
VGQNAPRLEGSIGIVELPLLIPAGASVAARISSNRGATALENVYANFFGQPSRPEQVWVGSFCESVGVPSDGSVPSGNLGASFTPGNSGSWGSWATVGTTVQALRFWQLYVAVNNATQANLSYYFQLAYGDGTNYVTIIPRLYAYTSTAEKIYFFKFTRSAHVSVPSGSTIYVRGVCSGTADTGWNAMALGVG